MLHPQPSIADQRWAERRAALCCGLRKVGRDILVGSSLVSATARSASGVVAMRTMSRVIRSTIALSMLMVSPASVFSPGRD